MRRPIYRDNTLLNSWVKEHLAAFYPEIRGVVCAATPASVTRRVQQGRYAYDGVIRWGWRMKSERQVSETDSMVFVALAHDPTGPSDIEIEELFIVPVPVVRRKAFVYRYRAHKDNRRASVLEPYKIPLRKKETAA